MSNLSLRHIYKVYPSRDKKKVDKDGTVKVPSEIFAVKDFNMEINDGEFVVFVGPSGCGKSTTLRMIAGLEDISGGELYIDGRLVNNVEPKERDIAMVFQSYALYPHMTSFDNIAFSLKMRKVSEVVKDEQGNPIIDEKANQKEIEKRLAKFKKTLKDREIFEKTLDSEGNEVPVSRKLTEDEILKELEQEKIKLTEEFKTVYKVKQRKLTKEEIKEKVHKVAKILEIEELLERKPTEMSGGQRQRIALGRCMVRDPKVFLLDEPLSNLDAKLRTGMRSEIVKLHREIKTTFIYVTHDQVEAMTMGTKIVVMKLGVVQQIDTPTNLFDFPVNKFVAGFIGTPQMNFFDVQIQKEKTNLVINFEDGQSLSYPLKKLRKIEDKYLDGNLHRVCLGIRGEHIVLNDKGLNANVSFVEILGSDSHLVVNLNGFLKDFIVCLGQRLNVRANDQITLDFTPENIHLFDLETELSIMENKLPIKEN